MSNPEGPRYVGLRLAHEIAAITGHASLKQVAHYTKAADQRRLAAAAMDKMRTQNVKPAQRFDKRSKKI